MTLVCQKNSKNSIFEYKGYTGSISICPSQSLIYLCIDGTDIQLSSSNLIDLKKQFENEIDNKLFGLYRKGC